jgi:multiple antibiotic resistance protein
VVVATLVMWIMMVLLSRRETHTGGGFLRDTATRFMGLIVIAMGTQFALTGLRDFFVVHP